MKTGNWLLIGGGVLALILWSGKASGAAPDSGSSFDFSSLTGEYDPADVARLQALYGAMQGKGLGQFITEAMLAQSLFETGLFTDNPNYHNMDTLNNYAGIQGNSRYAAAPGSSYAAYPSLNAFVNDWILVLSSGTQPVQATTLNDFINRLKQNGYFSDSIANYGAGVAQYFNLLDQIKQ